MITSIVLGVFLGVLFIALISGYVKLVIWWDRRQEAKKQGAVGRFVCIKCMTPFKATVMAMHSGHDNLCNDCRWKAGGK